MSKFKYIMLIIIIVSANKLYNQELPIFYYGAYFGYGLNSHSGDFNGIKDYYTCCPRYESGSGGGLSFGLLAKYPLQNNLSLALRLGYTDLSGEFNPQQKIGNTELRKAVPPYDNDGKLEAISEYSLISNLSAFTIEPYISWFLIESLSLDLGIRAAMMMNSTFSQSEILVSPDNVVFLENGTRKRNEYIDKNIEPLNSFQLAAMAGIGYKLPIGVYSYLSFDLRYYLPFTNIIDKDWKVSTLYGGVSLELPYIPSPDIQELQEIQFIRDTVTTRSISINEPEVLLLNRTESSKKIQTDNTIIEIITVNESYELRLPKVAKLDASLKITGITKDGKRQDNPTIIIEETETEEGFPILPHIFFPDGNSDITKSSMKLLNKNQVKSFTENGLNWETLDIYSDMLNVIAYRMLQNPKTKITITGNNNNTTNLEKGNIKLSEDRAIAVKNYLTDVWGINSSRIEIAKRNLPANPANNQREDGWVENSRAEISSNDVELMKPVYLKEIVVSSNPPVIEILPIVNAEAGINKWNVAVSQKDNNLRNYKGTSNVEKLLWQIEDEPMPKLEAPISIQLMAEDNLGKEIQAKQLLTLEQLTIKKKRYELKDDKRVERFSLIVFDFNKADLKQIHLKILNDIKSRIKSNSKVTILGYADRSGESEYNKDLAAKRTAEVQKILKVNPENLTIQNIGSDELIYDNSTPQGRSYCRTVKIIVETPVKE